MGMLVLSILLVFVISFFLGSIPWGIIISKYVYKTDIRKFGSGNIGTTNALRTLGKVGGGLVFLLDVGKGMLAGISALLLYSLFVSIDPGFIAVDPRPLIDGELGTYAIESGRIGIFDIKQVIDWSTGEYSRPNFVTREAQSLLATAACASILGSVFSPWLKFRGGKGIATAAGVLFVAFGWLHTIIALALFALLVIFTRYVSVGSITAATSCLLLGITVYWGNVYAMLMIAIAVSVMIWAHRGNIKRLRQGTELKIGDKLAKKHREQPDG